MIIVKGNNRRYHLDFNFSLSWYTVNWKSASTERPKMPWALVYSISICCQWDQFELGAFRIMTTGCRCFFWNVSRKPQTRSNSNYSKRPSDFPLNKALFSALQFARAPNLWTLSSNQVNILITDFPLKFIKLFKMGWVIAEALLQFASHVQSTILI